MQTETAECLRLWPSSLWPSRATFSAKDDKRQSVTKMRWKIEVCQSIEWILCFLYSCDRCSLEYGFVVGAKGVNIPHDSEREKDYFSPNPKYPISYISHTNNCAPLPSQIVGYNRAQNYLKTFRSNFLSTIRNHELIRVLQRQRSPAQDVVYAQRRSAAPAPRTRAARSS